MGFFDFQTYVHTVWELNLVVNIGCCSFLLKMQQKQLALGLARARGITRRQVE